MIIGLTKKDVKIEEGENIEEDGQLDPFVVKGYRLSFLNDDGIKFITENSYTMERILEIRDSLLGLRSQ